MQARSVFRMLGLLASGLAGAPLALHAQATPPRLIVFLAVDQLRPDYFARFQADLAGGFRRIATEGAFFDHGEQDHAVTETAPGHSTMLSGRSPASTGIVTNQLGVGDPLAPLLGSSEPGASPRRFQGTTFADWLLVRDSTTRILSVSMKDRGAILPIGRARVPVFWYSNGDFTTSRYYADTLPAWVQAFNARKSVEHASDWEWSLLLPAAKYAEPDSQPWLRGGQGTTFPHRLPAATEARALASQFRNTPLMDSLTLAFALAGVTEEALGRQDGRTDLLSVSLSATDLIGHSYGPDSRELHDQILRLDRYLGRFFDSLFTMVPANRVVVALTADHGVTSLPDVSARRGNPGGRVSFDALAEALSRTFGARYHAPFGFSHDSGLLLADTAALSARGVNVDSLAQAVRDEALGLTGVDQVFTPALLAASLDPGAARWQRTIPKGTGWLIAATAKPGYVWSLSPGIAMHGTTNPDDLQVPIAFFGPGIKRGRYDRVVRTVDIAPTLAALVGVRPTEKVEGVVLPEVYRK